MLSLILVVALAGNPHAVENTRCPVTGFDVRNHYLYHYVTVQGRKYYIYDRMAAIRLRHCPDCYLGKDGTPKNEAAPSR